MKYNKFVVPVLKWAGGKKQLLSEIKKHIPKKITTYYEPFIGGGAVLFYIQPKRAVISDINNELINFYEVIKNNAESIIEDLKKHKNEEKYFYDMRQIDREEFLFSKLSNVERASRIHFLNKTCYNGLFRVNQAGEFNTPFGRYKNPNFVNEITIKAVNNYFSSANITIMNCDFEESVKGIRQGAFVYFDPPYDPVSNSSNFTGYTKGGFDKNEQIRLKLLCDKLNDRGVKFLLSNSSTEFIHDLYSNYNIKIIKAKRAINSNSDKRGEIDEVLIKNYEYFNQE